MNDVALAIYRDIFADMIRENNPAYINNNSASHARVILNELINNANETVFIQCSHFAPDVYNERIVKALNMAQERGCRVFIAIRDETATDSLVRDLNSEISVSEHVSSLANDYCVVDGARFRYELNAHRREAAACAYDLDTGGMLAEIFVNAHAVQ